MSQLTNFIQRHDFPCWCGERKSTLFCAQLFGRHPFAVLVCAACGTHRLLPKALADQTAAETLYNQYAGAELSASDHSTFIQRMLQRLSNTGVELGLGKTILDVGCGTGVLLEAICAQFNCDGLGIDVDRRRISRAQATARRARFECGLFDPSQIKRKYDIVLATAIVEHVVDPQAFLTQLGEAVADGGSLFLLTPNARSLNYWLLRSWWRELLSIGEHIYLFTPDSLAASAKRAGFDLVRAVSDFDLSSPPVRLDSARNIAVTLWASYCASIKRVSTRLASSQSGDILSAHFRKSAPSK